MNLTIDTPINELNQINPGTLMASLGIQYLEVKEGYIKASMPVDERTIRPGNILAGGASLAFAETIGGLGSTLMIDQEQFNVVGISLSANHIGMATKGETVIGEAKIIHKGRTTHIWNIEIKNEVGKVISTSRLTNMLIEKK